MGGFGSVWHWVIVLLVVVLLFGAKKIPELAKGLGSGIKNFKKAVKEDDDEEGVDTLEPEVAKVEKPAKKRAVKTTPTKSKATSATETTSSEPKKRGRKPKSQTNV